MRAMYCSKACQKGHWKNGHKGECKKLSDAPKTPPSNTMACVICLDNDEHPYPIPLGCACRGNAGFAHPTCIARVAMADRLQSLRWQKCLTCKQEFTGRMELELAHKWWGKVKTYGKESLDRLMSGMNLASALSSHGKYVESEAMHRETIEGQTRVLGPSNPNTLNTTQNLANVLMPQSKYTEAEAIYRSVLETKITVLGPEHPDTLGTRMNLANALDRQGQG